MAARPQLKWPARLPLWRQRLAERIPLRVEGQVNRMVGLTIEAVGCQAAVGGICRIRGANGQWMDAEVVGFSDERLFLMPIGEIRGLTSHARVVPTQRVGEVAVGEALLGRVLDGAGRPIDGRGPLHTERRVPLDGEPINPMARSLIREPLDVGVGSINSLLTVGRGQRLGLFAGSGVGKSVLLGMMTRFTRADVTVLALIGERGREAREFIETILGPAGMERTIVVISPSNDPPLMRLRGAMLATAIAEYFRDRGRHVLLLMDSITRYAQAQREIALAVGEPPATKGYPPSVFARIPQLVERAGCNGTPNGSITAFYTVLVEGDDHNDPIADAVRATLDGHLVLSRRLAEAGVYPAIDIEASISRVMPEITTAAQQKHALRFRQMYSHYEQNRDLVTIGAYQSGADPLLDEAIALHPALINFLGQDMRRAMPFAESMKELARIMEPGPA